MAVIRLLVCGGRTYADANRLNAILDAVHRKHAIEVLIEGECPTKVNADKLARAWAESRGVPVDPCEVNHTLDGPWPGAGPRRNERMLIEKRPTHCIAFRGGNGTKNMTDQFNAWGLRKADAWKVSW